MRSCGTFYVNANSTTFALDYFSGNGRKVKNPLDIHLFRYKLYAKRDIDFHSSGNIIPFQHIPEKAKPRRLAIRRASRLEKAVPMIKNIITIPASSVIANQQGDKNSVFSKNREIVAKNFGKIPWTLDEDQMAHGLSLNAYNYLQGWYQDPKGK